MGDRAAKPFGVGRYALRTCVAYNLASIVLSAVFVLGVFTPELSRLETPILRDIVHHHLSLKWIILPSFVVVAVLSPFMKHASFPAIVSEIVMDEIKSLYVLVMAIIYAIIAICGIQKLTSRLILEDVGAKELLEYAGIIVLLSLYTTVMNLFNLLMSKIKVDLEVFIQLMTLPCTYWIFAQLENSLIGAAVLLAVMFVIVLVYVKLNEEHLAAVLGGETGK